MKKYWGILSKNKGFTLVELIVAIAMLGTIMISLLGFFLTNYKVFIKETDKIDVQEVARIGMDHIITNLRRAEQSSIKVIISTLNGITWYKLQLVIEGSPNKRYTYYLNGSNLIQQEEEYTLAGYWGNSAHNQLIYSVEEFKIIQIDDLITISTKIIVNKQEYYVMEYKNHYKIRN